MFENASSRNVSIKVALEARGAIVAQQDNHSGMQYGYGRKIGDAITCLKLKAGEWSEGPSRSKLCALGYIKDTPRYTHDCADCRFLYHEDGYDVYETCHRSEKGYLVRWSSYAADYFTTDTPRQYIEDHPVHEPW